MTFDIDAHRRQVLEDLVAGGVELVDAAVDANAPHGTNTEAETCPDS